MRRYWCVYSAFNADTLRWDVIKKPNTLVLRSFDCKEAANLYIAQLKFKSA